MIFRWCRETGPKNKMMCGRIEGHSGKHNWVYPIVGHPALCVSCGHAISDHYNNGTNGCDACSCASFADVA